MALMTRRLVLVAAALVVAGCTSTYRTYYDPVPADASRGWRVAEIVVNVPESLTVAPEGMIKGDGDILWEEDARGDRKVQVAEVMREGLALGTARMRGERPVKLVVDLARFHALSYKAEDILQTSGVHNVDFTATVVDARSGAVLAGPAFIEAATPAFSGEEAKRRRAAGESQRSVIRNHVARTIAGWLGAGPDNRGEFQRRGD